MKDRAFIANYPARFLTGESDRVQRSCRVGRTDGPTLTACICEQNSATLTHGPTVRVVDEKDVGEIVTPTFGEPVPRQASIIGSYDQTVSARSPPERLVG